MLSLGIRGGQPARLPLEAMGESRKRCFLPSCRGERKHKGQNMEINRRAEVALHGIAADMEWTMEFFAGEWSLRIEGMKDVKTIKWEQRLFKLSPQQAAAMTALFIAGDDMPEELSRLLYVEAEKALIDVPQHLRIIP